MSFDLPFTSFNESTEKKSPPPTESPSKSSATSPTANATAGRPSDASAASQLPTKDKISWPSANFSVGTHFHGNTKEDKVSLSSRKVVWSGVTETKATSYVSSWSKPSSGVTEKKAALSWSSCVTNSGWKSSSSSWSSSFGVTKEKEGSSCSFSGVTEKKKDSFVSKFTPDPPSMNRKRVFAVSSHNSRKRAKFSNEDRDNALQRLQNQPIQNHYIISRTPGVTRRVEVARKKCIVKDKVRAGDIRSHMRILFRDSTLDSVKRRDMVVQIKAFIAQSVTSENVLDKEQVVSFLDSFGVAKANFPRSRTGFTDNYDCLLTRMCNISEMQIKQICINRFCKPGKTSTSWFNKLSPRQKDIVSDNVSLMKDHKTKKPQPVTPVSPKLVTPVSNKFTVLGHSVVLKMVRDNDWVFGFRNLWKDSNIFLEMSDLPDDFFQADNVGHVLLAKMESSKVNALKQAFTFLKEEKAIKSLARDNDEFYCSSDEGSVDTVNSFIGSGVTRTIYSEKDVVFFLQNVVETNYIFDIGAQMQVYSGISGFDSNRLVKKCYCPFGFAFKSWKEETGIDALMEHGGVTPCSKYVFQSPNAFWQHCLQMGKNCILHFVLQKYLEQLYGSTCTKVGGKKSKKVCTPDVLKTFIIHRR